MAREGAAVVVAARNETLGEETVASIRAAGGKALFVATDVTREPQVRPMMKKTFKAYGKLTVLLNNAGIFLKGTVVDIPLADWDSAPFFARATRFRR